MLSSTTITKISSALVKAQAEMPKIKFDKVNPFLKNGYATLGAVIDTVKPVLDKHGLAVMQFPMSQEGRIGVRSVLIHESGEFFEDVIVLVPENAKGLSVNQSAGVTISYLRRYSLVSILGLYAEEDTDGDVTDLGSEKTQDKVKAVMARTWSLDQMEAVVEASNGTIQEHTDASLLLDHSVLPESAPVKTVASWFKHYMASAGATVALKAHDANEAYNKAKKTGGK